MDELISIMQDVLLELQGINSKLEDIKGYGDNSITDICSNLEDIKGTGLYNSLTDVCDRLDSNNDELREFNSKLDDIGGYANNSITDICSNLEDIKGTGLYNSLTDVCDKIDSLETEIISGR